MIGTDEEKETGKSLMSVRFYDIYEQDLALNNQRLKLLEQFRFGYFMEYQLSFNARATFVEKQTCYYWTHCWRDKWVHTFSKGISPKLTVIA